MIAYGAEVERRASTRRLSQYGLTPERYVLYVSRLEPENNAHLVIEAYEQIATDMPLVIVGGAPYARDYIKQLESTPDPRVKFLGFVFGEDYRALQQNAYCYVHATEVGGTHPALIEAMGAGNCALTLETPENREVAGDAGIMYSSLEDLVEQLRRVLDNPGIIGEYRHRAMARVKRLYNWEQILTSTSICSPAWPEQKCLRSFPFLCGIRPSQIWNRSAIRWRLLPKSSLPRSIIELRERCPNNLWPVILQ